MAERLGTAEQQEILGEITGWRDAFASGRLRARGFRQPKLESGERFACRIFTIEASGSGEPPIRGGAHVTDRRVFIVRNRPVPQREWRWADVPEVRLIKGWQGVLLGADPADVIVFQHSPTLATAINWLKLQGAHALAHDRFDEWFDGLPAWLAGDRDRETDR